MQKAWADTKAKIGLIRSVVSSLLDTDNESGGWISWFNLKKSLGATWKNQTYGRNLL